MDENHSTVLLRNHITTIIITTVVLAALVFLDIPQTIKLKVLVIKKLPLGEDTKYVAIMNLCHAAYKGTYDGFMDCMRAFENW